MGVMDTGYMRGKERSQIKLYTGSLEEIIGEENPAQMIDAFVDRMNSPGGGVPSAGKTVQRV
jgi:hypothetical protein